MITATEICSCRLTPTFRRNHLSRFNMTTAAKTSFAVVLTIVGFHVFICQLSPTKCTSIVRTSYVKERQTKKTQFVPSVVKVVFYAYMRGGSSVGYQMFNVDPSAFTFYEPLAAYYAANYGMRPANKCQFIFYTADWKPLQYSTKERNDLYVFVNDLYNCQFKRLPHHLWLHRFLGLSAKLRPIKKCVGSTSDNDPLRGMCRPNTTICDEDQSLEINRQNLCDKIYGRARALLSSDINMSRTAFKHQMYEYMESDLNSRLIDENDYRMLLSSIFCAYDVSQRSRHCMKQAEQLCMDSSLRVAKMLRMNMSEIAEVVEKHPDLSVVYFVRDPRATALSRINTNRLAIDPDAKDIILESKLLCQQMRNDIYQSKRIRQQSSIQFIQIKYEDFILNPITTALKMYKQLNIRILPVKEWQEYISRAFNSNRQNGAFSVKRQNASASIEKWKTEIKTADLRNIQNICADVLHEFNYPIVNV